MLFFDAYIMLTTFFYTCVVQNVQKYQFKYDISSEMCKNKLKSSNHHSDSIFFFFTVLGQQLSVASVWPNITIELSNSSTKNQCHRTGTNVIVSWSNSQS